LDEDTTVFYTRCQSSAKLRKHTNLLAFVPVRLVTNHLLADSIQIHDGASPSVPDDIVARGEWVMNIVMQSRRREYFIKGTFGYLSEQCYS
jgi:hypothetical protein